MVHNLLLCCDFSVVGVAYVGLDFTAPDSLWLVGAMIGAKSMLEPAQQIVWLAGQRLLLVVNWFGLVFA